jgi:hypothetical protein
MWLGVAPRNTLGVTATNCRWPLGWAAVVVEGAATGALLGFLESSELRFWWDKTLLRCVWLAANSLSGGCGGTRTVSCIKRSNSASREGDDGACACAVPQRAACVARAERIKALPLLAPCNDS